MTPASSKKIAAVLASAILTACGGSDGGGGPPPDNTPASLVVSPSSLTFGALGSQRQLTATYKNASNVTVTGPAPLFTRTGGVTQFVSVSATGLAISVGAGTGDTIVVTGSGFTVKVPVTVNQVAATIQVGSIAATPDTLFAATRTRQFSAVAKDSNNNAIANPTFAWASDATAVATVGAATGLVTAVTDGSANIQASSGAVAGSRPIVVRRLAKTHSISPTTGTISVNAGTAGPFTGAATDSANVAIPMSWLSRNTGIFTVSPSSGNSTTATGTGNGTAMLILVIPIGPVDSASITVSNQTAPPPAPSTATVNITDDIFTSAHNATNNPAVDTVAVNGTVTWNFNGVVQHNVTSSGVPSFTSSTTKSSGTHAFQFTAAGTYLYFCSIHGTPTSGMFGRIVVR